MTEFVIKVYDILIWLFFNGFASAVQEIISFMGDLSAGIFDNSVVQGLLGFFRYFGYCLFVVGCVIAVYEAVIQYQDGTGSAIRSMLPNFITGLAAALLFTTAPVLLYRFCLELQNSVTGSMLGGVALADKVGELLGAKWSDLDLSVTADYSSAFEAGMGPVKVSFIVPLLGALLLLYVCFRVFGSNLMRGGVLLTLICVGSLHLFGMPRGFRDGFSGWLKQIIGLCFTVFFQNVLFTLGFVILADEMYLPGIGLLLAATEVPRIAREFGLDTSMRGQFGGIVQTVGQAVNVIRMVR